MSAIEKLGIDTDSFKVKGKQEPSAAQEQTSDTFGFKWARRNTYESDAVQTAMKKWLFERYCEDDPERLSKWLEGGPKIILDAGCGSGFSALLFFGEHLKDHDYLGVDISDAVEIARTRFKEAGCPGDFLQCNILDLPIEDESVDVIFSEGVLHHTDSTKESLKYLSRKLKGGGLFLFYVYAKKGPAREFTDDHVREKLSKMSDEEAWEVLKPLTRLGIALGELNQEIDVPEDIPFLGIPKGKINLQRFFYWYICKMFYREDFNFDEMHHINFDWFRPTNCHRHTREEIVAYCEGGGLDIEHMNVQKPGITVVARKR